MVKPKKSSEINMSVAIMTMVKANIVAYVVTAIFILFASILLTYTDATPKFEQVISLMGIIASAALAGYDTAKIENRNGYKWGAVGGALYFVIFLVLGTVLNKLNDIAIGTVLLIAILVLLTGSIAGMISVNSEQSAHKRR